MTDLDDAIDEVMNETLSVSSLRDDLVLKKLRTAYLKAPFAKFDEEAIEQELRDLQTKAAFDTSAFPIDAVEGIKAAANARMDLQSARDRLISLSGALRKGVSKANRALRVGLVYVHENENMQKVSGGVKHKSELAHVVMREIAENYESMKLLLDLVKESLSAVDEKSKVLDAWFALHKQYVFMTANRGPRGEQETHDEARRRQPATLGRRRKRKHD